MSDEKTFKEFTELALRECAGELCDEELADRVAVAIDKELADRKLSTTCLPAGQLRMMGVEVPAHVPDCAEALVRGLRVDQTQVDPEDPSRITFRMIADHIDYRWVEMEVTVEGKQ